MQIEIKSHDITIVHLSLKNSAELVRISKIQSIAQRMVEFSGIGESKFTQSSEEYKCL